MSASLFVPPIDPPSDVQRLLVQRGYAIVDGAATARIADSRPAALDALSASWNDLPADPYLKDGGRYRRRRHSSFVVAKGRMDPVPQRAHWQPVEYNALHGGMQRWFAAIDDAVLSSAAWRGLVVGLASSCSAVRPDEPWYVEAHQFRIDTTDGIGRPTPEGAHRDGVDFVAVVLVGRAGIKGGETRVFDADGPDGRRFTMLEPWTLLLLDDARVIHETTPIQPLDDVSLASGCGHRDTLVLTFRSRGFQGDDVVVDAG